MASNLSTAPFKPLQGSGGTHGSGGWLMVLTTRKSAELRIFATAPSRFDLRLEW